MVARTNISLKERKKLTLGEFRGVDFSTSPLSVSSSRATKAQNFIRENGVNRKRHGWKSLYQFSGKRINGIFAFNGGYVIHAGDAYYFADKNFSTAVSLMKTCTYAPATPSQTVTDCRSEAFLSNGRLYLIGAGDYLVYGAWDGKYELRRVADNKDTYVPLTTAGIGVVGEETSGSSQTAIDAPNLLTRWRKNQLVGKEFNANAETAEIAEWKLDGKVNYEKEVTVVLTGSNGTSVLKNKPSGTYDEQMNLYLSSSVAGHDAGYRCGHISPGGYLRITDFGMTETSHIQVCNFGIEVTYYASGYAENASYITGCKFGALFGVNGGSDRLFLGGGTMAPNGDFHSETARLDSGAGVPGGQDFTYFTETSAAWYGSPDVPIVGYVRMSDGTLAVLKEENNTEPGVYYITGSVQSLGGESGITEDVFTNSVGAICAGSINGSVSANLAGDSLFLTSSGIYALVFTSNITTERGIRSRGYSVNERLKKSGFADACATVFGGKYYLSVGGNCYVADSGCKYSSPGDTDGSYQYEWWYWTNIPANCFASGGNSLMFGTDDGYICVFDNEFTDRKSNGTKSGQLSLSSDPSRKRLVYSSGLTGKIGIGDSVTFKSQGVFGLLLSPEEFTVSDGKIVLNDPEYSERFREGMQVYAEVTEESGTISRSQYLVGGIDRGKGTLSLADENGEIVSAVEGGFSLSESLYNKKLYISDINTVLQTFSVRKYKSEEAEEVVFGAVPTNPSARIEHRENVVAEWYSPVLAPGGSDVAKTLLGLCVTTEPDVNGKVSFGYTVRRNSDLMGARGIRVFDFTDLSFREFSFDTGFATSYTVNCHERNFNYIIFRFRSDTDTDCAVNRLTAIYKINANNRGVN